jgi:hypothetical protein
LLAQRADTGHPHLRIERKSWITPKNGVVTAGTNGRVKGKRRTTTIRIAMQPPIKVAVVRGAAVLPTPWRPAYFWRFRNSSIAFADQPRNRKVLSDRDFLQLL